MANEGHIIIKKGGGRYSTKQFFSPVDKGSSRPAFCYPRRAEHLKEELNSMQRNLDRGMIGPERKMAYEQRKKQLEERVGEIDASFDKAKGIIEKNKDAWKARRDTLANEIREATPTREDVRTRRVNPHSVLRKEKIGDKGSAPLEQKKREYTIISRAFQAAGDYEESNHSFLQKDK